QVPDGAVLTKALGCGACHAGVPEGDAIREMAPPFGDGMAPLAPAYIFHYLDDPQTVRPEIAPARMPLYDLSERERVALALFVTNERELRGVDDALRAAMASHPDADRAEGGELFETLNCGSCHLHPDMPPRLTAPDLGATGLRVRQDWLEGYLASPVTIRPAGTSPGRGGRMPDFRLSPAEITAISDFLLTLETPSPGDSPAPTAEAGPAQIPPWEPLALSPFSMQKAQTLLEDRWSCLGCHQLGEEGGRIGPRLDGIARRLRPEYVRHLIEDPAHLAPGTIMPSSLEQPDRLDLIASYLLLRDAPWTGSQRLAGMPALPASAADPGPALYIAQCASCHGVRGEGDGFNAPFMPVVPTVHADSAAMSLRTDDTLYDGIHAGGWILGKSHRMPAFGASLDDAQKRALVAHIRTLCRCQGPYWSRDGRRGR
ncbi:MAG: cytochrome c, partial [Gemmatimonadetes bacterium]|nr:cytochrome c [Gemmatimonadota bacterium]